MSKISLPLDRLNEALDGGVEDGSNVLILADLVVDKMKFGSSLVNYRLGEEDNIIYLVNNKLPVYAEKSVGDLEEKSDKVAFIDGFSSTIDKKSGSDFVVESKITDNTKNYISESLEVSKRAIKKMEDWGSSFIVDSVDSWVGELDSLENFLEEVSPVLKETNTVGYYLFPNLGFGEDDGETLERLTEMFDYVLHLKGIERTGTTLKYVDVRKPDIDEKIPFEVTPRGLVTYIPKILVTGPYNAGKSTFVETMSESSVSVDRLGTTVSLDHGKISRKGILADVFGTPGQERFDWAMDFLGKSIFGTFLIVDSRNPRYGRVKDMFRRLEDKKVPTLIVANFQNKEDALKPSEIEEKLGIETLGVDALNGEGVEEAVEKLFDKILSQHSWYYT